MTDINNYWPSKETIFKQLYPSLDYLYNANNYTPEYQNSLCKYKKTRNDKVIYRELMEVHNKLINYCQENCQEKSSLFMSILHSGYDEPECFASLRQRVFHRREENIVKTYNNLTTLIFDFFEDGDYCVWPCVKIFQEGGYVNFELSYKMDFQNL